MKKLCIGVIFILLFILCACNIDSELDSSKKIEDEPVSSDKENNTEVCSKHNFTITPLKKATCTEEGSELYQCKICGFEQVVSISKTEHDFSVKKCGEETRCSVCGKGNGIILDHTTDRGVCARCGTYYISTENKIADENDRHEMQLNALRTSYEQNYDSYYAQYINLSSQLYYSQSYIESRIAELQTTISSLQTRISISELDTTASGRANTRRLQSQLNTAKKEYEELYAQYYICQQIDVCYENLIFINNQYQTDINKENELHEANLKEIKESK